MSQASQTVDLPWLVLLLLLLPVMYLSIFVHELGHGIIAIVQGGVFNGITIYMIGGEANAQSPLAPVGGWIAQFVLVLLALLVFRRVKPTSFTANSFVLVLVVSNLLYPAAYIGSLWEIPCRSFNS